MPAAMTISPHPAKRMISTPEADPAIRKVFRHTLRHINEVLRSRHYSGATDKVSRLASTAPTPLHRAKAYQLQSWILNCQAADFFFIQRTKGNNRNRQTCARTALRSQAEEIAVNSLVQLLEITDEELESLSSGPKRIMNSRELSPEIKWPAASLLSTLGHIYDDTQREHPRMSRLKDLSDEFFECANRTNPCRLTIKGGSPISRSDRKAANY